MKPLKNKSSLSPFRVFLVWSYVYIDLTPFNYLSFRFGMQLSNMRESVKKFDGIILWVVLDAQGPDRQFQLRAEVERMPTHTSTKRGSDKRQQERREQHVH